MRTPATPTRLGVALAAACAVALSARGADVAADARRGTYRLEGRARVDARPFPATDQEVRADAVLSPGARAGEVRMRLAGQGFTCELTASLDAAGALTLPPGQRCAADLRSDEAEGQVEARLVKGSGRLRDEVLELSLAFELSGSMRARPGGTLDALARVAGAGNEAVPVGGQASGRAQGHRDRSRSAN